MNNIDQVKKEIRKSIKANVSALSNNEKIEQSQQVFDILEKLNMYKNASNIMAFWSMFDEINTHDFIKENAKYKQFFLPVMDGVNLQIRKFEDANSLNNNNKYGIFEPNGVSVNNFNPDIIIVPGVAFDTNKNRLGRGKAFYDRFLKSHKNKTPLIGLCYNEQLIDNVPTNEYDITMDYILTPKGLI